MSNNGANAPRITWHNLIDNVATDAVFNETVLEAVKAPEKGPRAPVVIMHEFRKTSGKDWWVILPEPGSDQEKRTNGLFFRISEAEANDRDREPKRNWDKYSYVNSQSETVKGSVYLEMVDRHPIGIALNEAVKIIDDWSDTDIDHANLPKVITLDGEAEDVSEMPGTVRDNRRSMFLSRRTRFANNIRRAVEIERNADAIKTHLSKIVTVGFVYAKEHVPSSGIAEVTETIRVIKLVTDPNAVDAQGNSKLGQESSVHESFTANQFINLSVEAVLKKPEKEQTYDALINSKRVRAARVKKGQGKSTATDNAESAATSGNLPAMFSNFRLFTENETATLTLNKRIENMKADERPVFITDLLETRDFLNNYCKKEWEDVRKAYLKVQVKASEDKLAQKLAQDALTTEAEAQPTVNQRLDAEADAALKTPSESTSAQHKPVKTTAAASKKSRAV